MMSGRNQTQAIMRNGKPKVAKGLSIPTTNGVISVIFKDLKDHFYGTWWDGIKSQEDMRKRADEWSNTLHRFEDQIVKDVVADLISARDNVTPTLKDFEEKCQIKHDSIYSTARRLAARAAHDAHRIKMKQMGVTA